MQTIKVTTNISVNREKSAHRNKFYFEKYTYKQYICWPFIDLLDFSRHFFGKYVF